MQINGKKKNKSSSFIERDEEGNITIKSNKKKKVGGVSSSKKASAVGFDGMGTNAISAYRSSYMNGGKSSGAFGDVPLPFVLLNENNGGIFYWPISLKEKYSWYRFLQRVDPIVGQAINLNVELPLSKIMLKMPKVENKEYKEQILKKYERVMNKLNLFSKMQSILREYYVIGNSFNFLEWDEQNLEWSKLIQLVPEEVDVQSIPMSDDKLIKYQPVVLTKLIKELGVNFENISNMEELKQVLDEDDYNTIRQVPFEILKKLSENEEVVFDSNPYEGDTLKVNSFVYQFARDKQEYEDYGSSILERVLNPLILRELFKNTQVGLASRNMTPKNKVSAPNITPMQLEELREQIDLSYLNPDYAIVTNYEWTWEQIGSQNRLLDLSKEYESIDQQLYSALGMTRELLTGDGMYSGSKISVELLNTRCLLVREMFIDFIEKKMFEPMAEANGFYVIDKFGNKNYLYPKVSFSRLTIRDNSEVFDSLFQLYQKGSLPVDIIYDLFNLNSDEITEKLKSDMFTPKDSQFNELIRNVYNGISDKIMASDIGKMIVESLKGPNGEDVVVSEQGGDDGFGGGSGGDALSDFFNFSDFEDEENADSTGDLSDEEKSFETTAEEADTISDFLTDTSTDPEGH